MDGKGRVSCYVCIIVRYFVNHNHGSIRRFASLLCFATRACDREWEIVGNRLSLSSFLVHVLPSGILIFEVNSS